MTRHSARHQRKANLQGASLIEVLVAVLLLSIGILSMVGLQTSALRLTKESQFQSSATELASSFSESVRANIAGAMAGNYTVPGPYVPPAGAIAQPAQCANPAVTCTPAQIAAVDIARWREAARIALPGGSLISALTVPAVATQAPVVTLWVIWQAPQTDDPNDAATGDISNNCPANMGGALDPQPQCMQFTIQL